MSDDELTPRTRRLHPEPHEFELSGERTPYRLESVIFVGDTGAMDRLRLSLTSVYGDRLPSLDLSVPASVRMEIQRGWAERFTELTPRVCAACRGLRWVCECHPGRPWGGLCCDRPAGAETCGHGACHCGGAGDPCPSCNPEGEVDPAWVTVAARAEP